MLQYNANLAEFLINVADVAKTAHLSIPLEVLDGAKRHLSFLNSDFASGLLLNLRGMIAAPKCHSAAKIRPFIGTMLFFIVIAYENRQVLLRAGLSDTGKSHGSNYSEGLSYCRNFACKGVNHQIHKNSPPP